jgi:hypothetical protein
LKTILLYDENQWSLVGGLIHIQTDQY